MKHEIQLTKDSNIIHVDNVDVSKGVYGVSINGIGSPMVFLTIDATLTIKSICAKSEYGEGVFYALKECLSDHNNHVFFTIPDNLRIVTEKPLTVDDLKDTDHVGFVTNGYGKGYIVHANALFVGIYLEEGHRRPNCQFGNGRHNTIQDLITNNTAASSFIHIYRFYTRKELYAWLAE